jgi:hypothetical protein
MKAAVDKLRDIVAWANSMPESFNDRIKSIADWETLYDLAISYDMDLIEDAMLFLMYDDEHDGFVQKANDLLGYELYPDKNV